MVTKGAACVEKLQSKILNLKWIWIVPYYVSRRPVLPRLPHSRDFDSNILLLHVSIFNF